MSFNKKKLTNLGPIRGCPHLRAVHNIAILFIKGCWVRTRIIADFQDVIPAMSNFLYARNIPSLDPTTAGSGTLGEIWHIPPTKQCNEEMSFGNYEFQSVPLIIQNELHKDRSGIQNQLEGIWIATPYIRLKCFSFMGKKKDRDCEKTFFCTNGCKKWQTADVHVLFIDNPTQNRSK